MISETAQERADRHAANLRSFAWVSACNKHAPWEARAEATVDKYVAGDHERDTLAFARSVLSDIYRI